MDRIIFYQGIRTALSHASPKEYEQIKGFVAANSKRDKEDAFKWFLCTIRHSDTGRYFLTAGMAYGPLSTQGLVTSRMRELLQLPIIGRPDPCPTTAPRKPIRRTT